MARRLFCFLAAPLKLSFSAFLLLPVVSQTRAVEPKAGNSTVKESTPALPCFLKSVRLPVPLRLGAEDEGEPRNEKWDEVARLLRVSDLRIYDWESAYDVAGLAEWQRRHVLQKLRALGYTVQKSGGSIEGWGPVEGFRARQGATVLSALWGNNGSHLYLYWGHEVPQTPARRRDDALIKAIIEQKPSDVQKWLQQGASPYAVDYSGASVLPLAGSATITQQLLDARKGRSGRTANDVDAALQTAIRHDNAGTVHTLTNAGGTDVQTGAGLRLAASIGATESARVLAPLSLQGDVDTALVTASFVEEWRGSPIQYPAIVKILLARKPSQSALDAALISAAADDEANLTPVLLAAGANVNARDSEGQTALMRAAADFHYNAEQPAVRALLDAGADPNLQDQKGETALGNAILINGPLTIRLLLSRGANPDLKTSAGKTAKDLLRARINRSEQAEEKRQLLAILQTF